jgi:hypothetical protein
MSEEAVTELEVDNMVEPTDTINVGKPETQAVANCSTAIGENVIVEHEHSIVIGNNLKSDRSFQIKIDIDQFKCNFDCTAKPELVMNLHKAIHAIATQPELHGNL